MPKLFGTNILLILLAGFLFFMLGWIWYGMLFQEQWMALTGITEEAAEATMGRAMAVGFLISLLQPGLCIRNLLGNSSCVALPPAPCSRANESSFENNDFLELFRSP